MQIADPELFGGMEDETGAGMAYWERSSEGLLDSIARLRDQGLDVIED